jgi:mannose-6-phosphate isomerase-like protein (cupin superfamily)
MKILRTRTAPRYVRDEGITSYLLASPRTAGGAHLTVTLVEIEPGGRQRIHRHAPEQIYYLLEGTGRMTVGSDVRDVQAGDCVFIPSQTDHGLENTTKRVLKYLSAAAPAFPGQDLDEMWPLPPATREGVA